MTITGSEGSFRTGGPQMPLQEDTQKTAANLVAARSVLISKDSINDPIAMQLMINTDESKRSDRYQSQSSKPSLAPLLHIRLGSMPDAPPDDAWIKKYENLIQKLPTDAHKRFLEENSRPFDQRHPLYVSLDNLMRLAAKFLANLETLGRPLAPNSPAADRHELNTLIPYVGMVGAHIHQTDFLAMLARILADIGRNHPLFEPMTEEAAIFAQQNSDLSLLVEKLRSGQASREDIQSILRLIAQLKKQITRLQRQNRGGTSALLLPHLKALLCLLSAFSNPEDVSPSLMLSLEISQIGSSDDAEGSGWIGEELSHLFDQLSFSDQIREEDQARLKTLLLPLLSCFGLFAGLIEKNGLGVTSAKEEKEIQQVHLFDLQLIMHTGLKTKFIDILANQLSHIVRIPEKEKNIFYAQLSLFIISTCVIIGSAGNIDKQKNLLSTLNSFIQPSFEKIAAESVHSDLQANPEDSQSLAKVVLLQQAWMAFEQGHLEHFIQLMQNIVKTQIANPEQLEKDIASFRSTSERLAEGIQGGAQEKNRYSLGTAIAV